MSLPCIFHLPPLGKPDFHEPKPEGEDTRSRIPETCKIDACWYYAFSKLRERFKAPNTDGCERRVVERRISRFKKSAVLVRREYRSLTTLLEHEGMANVLQRLFPSRLVTEGDKQYVTSFINIGMWDHSKLVEKFSLKTDLIHFVAHIQNRREALQKKLERLYETFLLKHDPIIHETIRNLTKHDLQDLPSEDKLAVIGSCFVHYCAHAYGFRRADWNPDLSIIALITEIAAKGPFVIGGTFGPIYYTVPPQESEEEILGRKVYYWKKGDPRADHGGEYHSVVLVGAKKNGTQELVYYIDPNDVSDPEHPEQQHIYAMSYQRLTDPNSILGGPDETFAYYSTDWKSRGSE